MLAAMKKNDKEMVKICECVSAILASPGKAYRYLLLSGGADATNVIRDKNQAINFMRLSSRIDGR